MNVLDLFSGIGGFSLGLERAGFKTVAFCEIDPYCRAVLKKHWPDVPVFGDIKSLTGAEVLANAAGNAGKLLAGERKNIRDKPAINGEARIDVVCGGFPCQDISVAGKGAGIEGERSGLWTEYARIIGELRPRYAIVENVSALLGRGLSDVLGDLAALGYDCEWHCIPASAVGAPHRRDRIWIIAYCDSWRQQVSSQFYGSEIQNTANWHPCGQHIDRFCNDVAHPTGTRQSQQIGTATPLRNRKTLELAGLLGEQTDHWLTEPDVGRVAHGVPSRVDRLRSLGNSVVPQIPEIIGRAIMAIEFEK